MSKQKKPQIDKSPYPWFGGKHNCIPIIHTAFGSIKNLVDPFAGSCVLPLNPPPDTKIITINDIDVLVSNFWRALKINPNEVIKHLDTPVSETELHARQIYVKTWLDTPRMKLRARFEGSENYVNYKVAAYWIYIICNSIGDNALHDGPWNVVNGEMIKTGKGIKRSAPHMGDAGRGIFRSVPHMGGERGINRKLPHMGDAGRGINRKLPLMGNAGVGINRKENCDLDYYFTRDKHMGITHMLKSLAKRIQCWRIICGPWQRAVKDSILTRHGSTGLMLDPPYNKKNPDETRNPYTTDEFDLNELIQWVDAHYLDKNLKICLCGYSHMYNVEKYLSQGWQIWNRTTHAGYSTTQDYKDEILLFSPNCESIA